MLRLTLTTISELLTELLETSSGPCVGRGGVGSWRDGQDLQQCLAAMKISSGPGAPDHQTQGAHGEVRTGQPVRVTEAAQGPVSRERPGAPAQPSPGSSERGR